MDHHLEREHLNYFNHGLVSRAQLNTLSSFIEKSTATPKDITELKENIISQNPYNIIMYNLLDIFLKKATPKDIDGTRRVKQRLEKEIVQSEKEITHVAEKRITSGTTILVYSLNNTVYNILDILNKHKKIKVNLFNNTFFNWEDILSKKQDFKCNFFHPFEVERALNESDICLFGSEVMHKKGMVSMIGTNMISKRAKEIHIPTYFCSPLLKYDFNNRVIFALTHKKDNKYIYENVDNNHVSAIFSDRGIFKPQHIIDEAHHQYKFLI